MNTLLSRRCNAGMFIGDEVRAEVSAGAATTRLAALARGGSLAGAAEAALDAGKARIGQAGPEPGPCRLVQVHWRGPVQRGAVSMLMLRWQAADGSAGLFPILDADITLVPDGDHGTLVGLLGVYRTPSGTGLDRSAVHGIAAVTIRTFLDRIAEAISNPAAPKTRPRMPSGAARQDFRPCG